MNPDAHAVSPSEQTTFRANVPSRLLAGVSGESGSVPLERHLGRFGALPELPRRGGAPGLFALADESGLTGRGGSGFPTGRKLRAVAEAGRSPVVLANGMEGEPVSGKDRALLRHAPHLVLDGVSVAAAAIGAKQAIIAIRADAEHAVDAVASALAERERARMDTASFRLVGVPEGFVAGEETALVNWLNTGRVATPLFKPPLPFEHGVRGVPTLVQNVETLAHLALIARFGAAWFRALGTAEEPGTALVTLSGAVTRPGIYEIPLGLRLGELLEWADGRSRPLSAFLVGGYFGGWVSADEALRLQLLDSELARNGTGLGARAIFALPAKACGVYETARVTRYLAGQSAGQCGPCVHGLDAIASELEWLAWGDRATVVRARERLTRWLRQVPGRGACRHPDGVARLVQSALTTFEDELDRHERGACVGDATPQLPVGPCRSPAGRR